MKREIEAPPRGGSSSGEQTITKCIRYQRADQQTDIVWICHREVMQL